jgi:hypothetical protein
MRKVEATFVELDDILFKGKSRYRVIAVYYNSGGLGDNVRFKVQEVKSGKESLSNFFAHNCLLEVERFTQDPDIPLN